MEQYVAGLLAQIASLRAQLARSQHELRLWKSQLDLAQKEILRAQRVVDDVDRARVDAEERAHRYRQSLRQLLDERAVQLARDEGRLLGYREGLQFGRASDRQPRAPSRPAPPASVPLAQPIRPHANPITPTYDVPPDNYIPTGGDAGLAIPPPHEWTHLASESIQQPPRSVHSARPDPVIPSPIQQQPSTPPHNDDLAGPPSSQISRRSRMTLPERIADQWRSQNPDVRTPPSHDDGPVLRPMSSSGLHRPNLYPEPPPQRPTTTAPTPSNASRHSTLSRDNGEWSRSRSLQQHSSTPTPDIAVESPSLSPVSPSNNTERTAVDSGLLSPTQQYQQPHLLTKPMSSSSSATSHHPRPFSIPPPPLPPPPPPPSSAASRDGPPTHYHPKITFAPLSPIPALSNLAAIPENTSSSSGTRSSRRSNHHHITRMASPLATFSGIIVPQSYSTPTGGSSTTSYPNSLSSSVPVPGPSSSDVFVDSNTR